MITALLLNWKRPYNLIRIITGLRQQSIPVTIFVWNNNIQDITKFDADMQINSGRNLMCSPRWLMGAFADTKYVFSLDDDLMITRPDLLERSINFIENCKYEALGYTGVQLNSNLDYWRSKHIAPHPMKDQEVDIIKGRFIITTKENVGRVDWINEQKANNYRIEDDIILSSKLTSKIIPASYYGAFMELPQPYALMREKDHKISRQQAIQKYFKK